MNSDGSSFPGMGSGIDPVWDELARDQRDLAAVGPVLRHLVGGESNALFGDEPIARTRGMIESLADELLRQAGREPAPSARDPLVRALVDVPALLGHAHALAMEAQIVARLAEQGIDPVLSPLVQDRIGSPDPQMAALAMTLMAAQTRYVRRQQRMELAAVELPADLLHACLGAAEALFGPEAAGALALVRAGYDERRGRLGVMAQLGLGLGDDFGAALDPGQGGFSLFATALSLVTGQDRDAVVLAAANPRPLRLALMLALAGVEPAGREAAVLRLNPDLVVEPAWFTIDPHHAGDLLAEGHEG